jgi:hypothetical protein
MKNYFAFFAVIITLAFAPNIMAQENEPVQVQIVQSKVILTLNEETHDFGTIPEGPNAACEFEVKNTGTEPLVIYSVTASCGCTVPEWPKEPIAPGKSGEIKVVFDSNGKSGAQSKRVTIVSNTNPPESFLYLEGDVTGSAPQGN